MEKTDKAGERNKKFFQTKAEAWLTLISILEIILFLLTIFEYVEVRDELWRIISTSIISIICSIIAAMWVPKVVQEESYQSLEDSIAERVTSKEKLSQDENKKELHAMIENMEGKLISENQATQSVQEAVLQKELQNQAEDIEKRIKELLEQNKYILPTATYVDTNDPNREFNKTMNESISATQDYLYFSDRALYLTKRLGRDIHNNNNRLKITVLLADVREMVLFTARDEIYLQQEQALQREDPTRKMRTREEIINEEKLKVLQSLYALGRLKEKYNIQVYLHKEIPFIRFEITDDLLGLSFLTQLSTGKQYPSTVLYKEDSLFRLNFEDYAKEVIKRSYLMKAEELELENLLEMGKQANIAGCDEEAITSHYYAKVKR